MSDDDRRATRAIAAILERAANDGSHDHYNAADVTILANEIVQALRGHGWRPTNATRRQPWQATPGEALGPDIVHACAAEVRAALTEALERAAQIEGTHAATNGGTHGP